MRKFYILWILYKYKSIKGYSFSHLTNSRKLINLVSNIKFFNNLYNFFKIVLRPIISLFSLFLKLLQFSLEIERKNIS